MAAAPAAPAHAVRRPRQPSHRGRSSGLGALLEFARDIAKAVDFASSIADKLQGHRWDRRSRRWRDRHGRFMAH